MSTILAGLTTVLLIVSPFILYAAEPPQLPDARVAVANRSDLPDTGQSNHYTQTFGEDSDFIGRGPTYGDNGDGTVTDRVTGLIWQKADGGEMTWEQAREFASKLRLGGHEDWRLPNSMELFSIVDHGKHGPALNTEYFPRTEARYWWTDSTRADDDSKVWAVNTGGGIGAHSMREAISAGGDRPFHVRCVRGDSLFSAGPSFHDHGNGTVTDEKTGLIWQKIGADKAMSWEEALRYCDGLLLAGRSDWRLPNIKELRSISDDHKVEPSLDREFFPEAQAAQYWSSTSQGNRPERAWFVDFTTGLVSYSDKPEKHLVLAVRGGNSAPTSRVKSAPHPSLLAPSGKERGPGKGKKPR